MDVSVEDGGRGAQDRALRSPGRLKWGEAAEKVILGRSQ